MIPLQDINTPRRQTFPFVTTAIILVNIAVFVYELTLTQQSATCFSYAYSFDPAVITGKVAVPAAYAASCAGSSFHLITPWATAITAMFLHAGLIHIVGNMLFLFVFGDNVEDRFGHLGFLIFYLFCGIAADLAQTLINPSADIANLGASGAIAGVLGSYLLLFPRARIRTFVFLGIIGFLTTISAIVVIVIWFLLQLFDGYASLNMAGANNQGGIGYFAHIGGFLAGFIITLLLKPLLPANKTGYANTTTN